MKKIFRKLILIELVLLVLMIISIFIESEEIAYMNEQLSSGFSDVYILIGGIFAVIVLLMYLVNLFLLYKFKNIGKPMYLVLLLVMALGSLLGGPIVYEPSDYLIDGLGWAMSGAILVFLYFTPIKKEFKRRN